jgi:hypothetical protein
VLTTVVTSAVWFVAGAAWAGVGFARHARGEPTSLLWRGLGFERTAVRLQRGQDFFDVRD